MGRFSAMTTAGGDAYAHERTPKYLDSNQRHLLESQLSQPSSASVMRTAGPVLCVPGHEPMGR
jgi:hypothetical protein